ncbi:MAG: DNA polymerase III subunit delta' [Eubacterium sp.]|nr:DNA polymerase III subunit delta' [Eubacterium sp.]
MDFHQIIGHEEIIRHFKSSIETGRAGHAYILCGEDDSGRKSLAFSYAKALQCEKGEVDPCNVCPSCIKADAGTHPDIITVHHEKPNLISVDEVREQVVQTMDIRPYNGKYKIYIIPDAQMMNDAAQNALLKTIEEPPAYGVVILITNSLEKLLPTILSRCVTLSLKPVRERDVKEYLMEQYGLDERKAHFCVEYAQGNLGKAVKLATNEEYEALVRSVIRLEKEIYDMDIEDIEEAIEACIRYKLNIGEYLDLMMMWYRDILMLKVTGKPDKVIFREEYSTLREQANYLSFNELEDKSRAIDNAKVRLNANARLEDVMRLLIMTLKER